MVNVSRTARILAENKDKILKKWIEAQMTDSRIRGHLIPREEWSATSRQFIEALIGATASGNLEDITAAPYQRVRGLMSEVMAKRESQGLTPFEAAASFICFKDSWHPFLQVEYHNDPDVLNREVVIVSKLVDGLALAALESAVKRREEIIARQAREITELSTPVVQVWEGVLVTPLIGTLDSQRTQQFMERLLERIVETNSPVALIDVTGVPVIDTKTAQHLMETVSAVRLLGAQVILTGVRPVIAQTLVHLGIELGGVITRSSLASGLQVAFDMLGLEPVSKNGREQLRR